MKKATLALCLLLVWENTTHGANSEQDLRQAASHLQAGTPQEAYELLRENHDPESTNPQEWFLLGMSAKQLGKFEEATRYFKRLLILDPNASRVKLELAEIIYRQGDSDKARQLLLDVKAAKPPERAVSTIDRFLAQISASEQQRKNWRIRASAGFMYDSNANAGPNVDSVLMYNLPFTLSDDAKETSDHALVLGLGFDHIKNLNASLNWQSNLSANWTNYRNLDDLDTLSFSLSTGPSWKPGDQLILSLPVVVDRVKIGQSPYYSQSYGIAPQLRYQLNEKISLGLTTSTSKKKYRGNSDRNLSAWSLSPSLDYSVSEQGSLRVGLTGSRERSGLAIYSNDLIGANASYYHNFTADFIGTFRAGYSTSHYRGQEAAYSKKRRDRTSQFGLDLTYRINAIDSELVFSASHTRNNSNLPIYKYDRNQLSLNLQKSF